MNQLGATNGPLAQSLASLAGALAPGLAAFFLSIFAIGFVGNEEVSGLFLGPVLAALCWIAFWMVFSVRPIFGRGIDAACRFGGIYLGILAAPCWLSIPNLQQEILRSLLGWISLFFAAAAVAATLFRLVGWRHVRHTPTPPERTPQPTWFQFRLGDVLHWTTAICTLLAIGVAVVPQFKYPVTGWDGIGYAVAWVGSLILCVPTGALALLFYWLVLGRKWNLPRKIVVGVLSAGWVAILLLFLTNITDNNPGNGWGMWIFLQSLWCSLLAMAVLVRLCGWRLERVPWRKTPSVGQASRLP